MIELIIKKLGINGYDIYGISENRFLVREFITNLEGSNCEKLWALLKRIAEYGPPPSEIERAKRLRDIYKSWKGEVK